MEIDVIITNEEISINASTIASVVDVVVSEEQPVIQITWVEDIDAHNHNALYYTKIEINEKLTNKSDVEHEHDDRYYSKTDADNKYQPKGVYLISETDPTVPLWAKQAAKPTYTANEVGASPTDHNHDSRYYTEAEIDTKLAGKSDTTHDHDSRYYTEAEIDTKLAGKSDTTHNHDSLYEPVITKNTAFNKDFGTSAGTVLEGNVKIGSVNLATNNPVNWESGYYSAANGGAPTSAAIYIRTKVGRKINPSSKYTASAKAVHQGVTILFFDSTATFISSVSISTGQTTRTFTTPVNADTYKIYTSKTGLPVITVSFINELFLQIEEGDKDTTFSLSAEDVDLRYGNIVSVPSAATSAGTAGQIAFDGTYLYVCTATNTWRRTSLNTW